MQETALEKREKEILSRIPWKAGIFLPTDKFSPEDRVRGLERVLKIWENDWGSKYCHELRSLRKQYGNRRRCFIIGNGPSLTDTNLDLLTDEVTFGVNGIFLKFAQTVFRPTFYVVEDHLVAEDRCDEINRLTGPVRLFPIYTAYCLDEGLNTVFFNHRPRVSYPHGFDFSTDASKVTYAGCTVTFTCMQLAFYFGFRKIYLIGVDHNYVIPQDVKQANTYGTQVLDMTSHDPNHFHPDYFGKGRRWHDPQVAKMEQAFREAFKVTRAHGVDIINATIGGKLEVFPRVDYYTLFRPEKNMTHPPPAAGQPTESAECAPETDLQMFRAAMPEYPMVLIIDFTRMGGESATGQLKKTLFAGWPPDRLMQVFSEGIADFGVHHEIDAGPVTMATGSTEELMAVCQSFAPDVIYYRPVAEHLHMHDLALKIIDRLDLPLITHMMDDWPMSLKYRQPELHSELDASLRSLFARSHACLSICDAMSITFRERYGVDFKPISNCVDPSDWTALDRERKERLRPGEPFVILYAGALADDKELQSVIDVAQTVDSLQDDGMDVRLEVHTMPNWKPQLRLLENLKGVSADASFLPDDEYRKLLLNCDALLLAYNFDDQSIRYTRYSLANSLPEMMASGVPIVAYGPPEVATIAYAASGRFALTVTQRDRFRLRNAILDLALNPEYGRELGQTARQLAFEHHNSATMRERFRSILCEAATHGPKAEPEAPLVSVGRNNTAGPFERHLHASFDENRLVAALLSDTGGKPTMVDVGAHLGGSLAPFLNLGWRVFAFEPDPANRNELGRRFEQHRGLTIDDRAVTNRATEDMPFYASAQSTGISSLQPFHESHREKFTVSTTTIADYVREKTLHSIDYLKIDAEGYDFQVLEGVPWDSLKPAVIMCEFEDSKTVSLGYTMHDMARYLIEHGYTVLVSEWHPIVRYGVKHDWHRLVRYPCELNSPDAWGNLIAFLEDPGDERLRSLAIQTLEFSGAPTGRSKWPHRHAGLPYRLAERLISRHPGLASYVVRRHPRLATMYRQIRDRGIMGHLRANYPTLMHIARFARWGLGVLKRTFFGIGGIALLVVAGLFVAGALVAEPLRWYLIGIAGALLLLCAGVLALSYARSVLSQSFVEQRRQIAANSKAMADVDRQVADINRQVSGINKQVYDNKNTLANTNVGNFPRFQQFNRRLTDEDLKRFAGEWAQKLGLDLNARALAYIAHRICLAEDTCIGRLSGNIETMVLRVLVARSLRHQPNLEMLEIGTLFGTGVAMIHENCRGLFNTMHFTVIDPLIGHISPDDRRPAGCLDSSIKVPATREIFVHNMQRMNIPESDYTIIQKLSTEDEAIEQASKKSYNLLIIDGDHTDPGVKHDFFSYRHMVKPGGYIFFDDYGNPNWPGLTRFIDEEVARMPELELVGTDVYSAVFRVIAPPDSTQQETRVSP